MKNRFQLFAIIISLAALVAGYSLQKIYRSQQSDAQQLAEVLAKADASKPNIADYIGQPMTDFLLPDLQNVVRSSNEWRGKVLLINFWASWCAPCLKEMPLFVATQTKYAEKDLQIIGIAIDDPQMAYEFASEIGVNYPILYGREEAMDLGKAYGNQRGTLPYSAFVDRKGLIQHIHYKGELESEALESILQPLL